MEKINELITGSTNISVQNETLKKLSKIKQSLKGSYTDAIEWLWEEAKKHGAV